MFDENGMPLESLKLFRLIRSGNLVPLAPDAIEDVNLTVDLNGEIVLPETVNAVMNDGSKQALPVSWDFTEADAKMMREGGVNKYTVTGTARGMEATAFISMAEFRRSCLRAEAKNRKKAVKELRVLSQLFIKSTVHMYAAKRPLFRVFSAVPGGAIPRRISFAPFGKGGIRRKDRMLLYTPAA